MSETIAVTDTAREIGHYPIAELLEKKVELVNQGLTVFDFGPGDDPLPIDPKILEAFKAGLPNTSSYPLVRGTKELRESIARYLKRRFQATVELNEILPVTGSKEGIYHLPGLLIDKHSTRRKVLGPALFYPPYLKGTLAVDGEYVPLHGGPKEDYLIELADVPKATLEQTAIAYLNYPHNPTGAGCSLDYLKRQVEVAHQYGFLLVSDECYVDLYFGESAPPSILEITKEGVMAFHSLSKRSGMTGFRSGFAAGDAALIDGYARLRNSIGTAMPQPIMVASIAAWDDDQHVEQRREIFRAIRSRFLSFLTEIGIEYLETEASFYLWAKAPNGMSAKNYCDALRARGIFVSPSDFFGEGSPEWFRISLVLPVETCEQAFVIWKEVHGECIK